MQILETINQRQKEKYDEFFGLFTKWATETNKQGKTFRPFTFYEWVRSYLTPEEFDNIAQDLRKFWKTLIAEGYVVKNPGKTCSFSLGEKP